MRRGWSLLLTVGLVAAACSGDTTSPSTATAPPVTAAPSTTPSDTAAATTTTSGRDADRGFQVFSEDGDLEVRVPVTAMAEDLGISIRLLSPDEYPPELAGAAENPGTRIYNLEPEGLTFDAPVRVIRRIPAANFGDLAATEIPVVYLVTQNPAGEFELFDSLEVMRDGDDLFVGGETTHFSPVISISGQVNAEIVPDAEHSVFATEVGTNEFFGIEFKGSDGTLLNKPSILLPVMRVRESFMAFDSNAGRGNASQESVQCTGIGEAKPRLGFVTTLSADPEPNQAGLVGVQSLIPGLMSAGMQLKIAQPFKCLDPKTSIIGTSIQFTIQTDHPGGVASVPNGDFRGGLSAGWGVLNARWADGYQGLITDSNGNGKVDIDDNMYEPQMVDSGGGVVLPLYSFGDYFLYTVDAASYSPLPSWGPSPYSVHDGLVWLNDLYEGDGRFETSVGVLGVDGAPFQYTVDSSEQPETVDGEVLLFRFSFRFLF